MATSQPKPGDFHRKVRKPLHLLGIVLTSTLTSSMMFQHNLQGQRPKYQGSRATDRPILFSPHA